MFLDAVPQWNESVLFAVISHAARLKNTFQSLIKSLVVRRGIPSNLVSILWDNSGQVLKSSRSDVSIVGQISPLCKCSCFPEATEFDPSYR